MQTLVPLARRSANKRRIHACHNRTVVIDAHLDLVFIILSGVCDNVGAGLAERQLGFPAATLRLEGYS